eukprot:Seg2331.2 transcript_id=Seg2331.2/GoldUCD/mRNA.D3Y31 product="hypothetical protein" pseudo=true protein_id=Seg2331.2/GoldUCD/D3Y31
MADIRVNFDGKIKYVYYDAREKLGRLKKDIAKVYHIREDQQFCFANYKGERLTKIRHGMTLHILLSGEERRGERYNERQQNNRGRQQEDKDRKRERKGSSGEQERKRARGREENVDIKKGTTFNLTINIGS